MEYFNGIKKATSKEEQKHNHRTELCKERKKNRLKGQLSIKGKTTISDFFLFLLAAPAND